MELKTTIIHTTIRGNKDRLIANQDFIQFSDNDDLLVATVSDGLGSSIYSDVGAKIACESVIKVTQNLYPLINTHNIDKEIRKKWNKEIALKRNPISDFRTTSSFVAVFKKKKKIIIGQLGDVMISLRIDGLFRHLKTLDKDFSNETPCLGSGHNEKYTITSFDFDYSFDFLIASDGIGDELQLDKIERLHDYFKMKFSSIEASQRNHLLQKEIISFVNKKNNDDKSMIFIWTNKR